MFCCLMYRILVLGFSEFLFDLGTLIEPGLPSELLLRDPSELLVMFTGCFLLLSVHIPNDANMDKIARDVAIEYNLSRGKE